VLFFLYLSVDCEKSSFLEKGKLQKRGVWVDGEQEYGPEKKRSDFTLDYFAHNYRPLLFRHTDLAGRHHDDPPGLRFHSKMVFKLGIISALCRFCAFIRLFTLDKEPKN
jgi:hypothetical protein